LAKSSGEEGKLEALARRPEPRAEILSEAKDLLRPGLR
jgi:hypothetical protein